MKKSFIITLTFVFLCCAFSFKAVFANDGLKAAGNTIENVTRDAGNAIGATVSGAGNAVESTINGAGNMISNGVNGMKSSMDNMSTSNTSRTAAEDENNYTATRTATETQGRFMGMTATGWTWAILAILGALIIAFVWYYSKENTSINSDSHNR